MLTSLSRQGIGGNFPNLIKIICPKPTTICREKNKGLKMFSLNSLNRQVRNILYLLGDASQSNKMDYNNNKSKKESNKSSSKYSIICSQYDLHHFSVTDQMLNILGFARQKIFVTTT